MKIGLVTCSALPASAAEDEILAAALRTRGFDVKSIVWDRPSAWREMDTLVFRSVWNYHHHIDRFDAWLKAIEQAGVRTINSLEQMRWNSRKAYLLDLQQRGIPTVETRLVEEGVSLEMARDLGWQTLVIKPLVGASAHGIRRVDCAGSHGVARCSCRRAEPTTLVIPNGARNERSEGPQREETARTSAGKVLIQPYLPEIETEGEWSLVYFDGVFSHAMRKRPATGDFRVQVEHGGHSVSAEPTQPLLDTAKQTLEALDETPTYARVDLVETAAGPRVMELELIEPELFLGECGASPTRFATAIGRRVRPI